MSLLQPSCLLTEIMNKYCIYAMVCNNPSFFFHLPLSKESNETTSVLAGENSTS